VIKFIKWTSITPCIQNVPELHPQKKKEYLGKIDNLNFKEKSPILSGNRETNQS
jgi:hypothetical protein